MFKAFRCSGYEKKAASCLGFQLHSKKRVRLEQQIDKNFVDCSNVQNSDRSQKNRTLCRAAERLHIESVRSFTVSTSVGN